MSTPETSPTTERAGLREFLDYQREALVRKVEGLSNAEARLTPTESQLSLLSILKHSTVWERRWFQVIMAGHASTEEWPGIRSQTGEDLTFHLADLDTIESVIADYQNQVAASNEVLTTFELDAPCAWPGMAHQNLRFVALHMIEETARHAGHADIIRETIDGSQGC
jgi:uncharacterized damage-inducible protein DinB